MYSNYLSLVFVYHVFFRISQSAVFVNEKALTDLILYDIIGLKI